MWDVVRNNERATNLIDEWEEVDEEYLRKELAEVWISCEWPAMVEDYEVWSMIFIEAGFISDDGTEQPEDPYKPVTLYRAAVPEYAYGMSWTTSLEQAKWFNKRNHGYGWEESKVFKTEIISGHILAIFNDRKEKEYVINHEVIDDIEVIEGV